MGFAGILRQSTAVDVLIGPFVDSADGDSEESGLTIAQADVRLSKNGQTAAQKNDNTTCAHDADGFYNCELDATDTNTVGQLTLYVHVSGALCVRHDFQVLEENVYDAWCAASAAAGTDLAAILVDTGTTLDGKLDTLDSTVAAILADTGTDGVVVAAGSKSGYSLAADQAGVTVGTVNALGAQAKADVGAEVDTALSDYDAPTKAELDSGLGALNDLSAAEVNAEVVDALATDTYAEPGQGAPAATTTLAAKLGYLYKAWRNKKDNDGTTTNLYADNGTTVDQKQDTSEDSGTVSKAEWVSGA